MKSSKRSWVKCGVLILTLLLLTITSLLVGRYRLPISAILDLSNIDKQTVTLLFHIRMPRTILVILSGAGLSLSGYIYQKIFQNPLVSPDILGVSSGCSLGAVIAIVFFGSSALMTYGLAFLFGLIAVILALFLTKAVGNQKLLAMVISGIVVSSMASSGIMLTKYFADPYTSLPSIEFWLMGGFYNSTWGDVLRLMPIVIVGSGLLFMLRWQIEIIALGDDEARMLGCNPNIVRRGIILTTTIIISATVAISGLISWMSLIAPHVSKLYIKERSSAQMLGSMICGSTLLLVADLMSRTLFSAELPISILISFVGGPFLAIMMYRQVMK